MIRSSGVNQLINDLITRLENSHTFADDVVENFKWENTGHVTVYDFQRSSDDLLPTNNNNSNNTTSAGIGGPNPTPQHLQQPLLQTPPLPHSKSGHLLPTFTIQQHHQRVVDSKSFAPSDVDHVHGDQIYLPQSFDVTMQTLETALRQGSILSFYQHRIAASARELMEILPHVDLMLRESFLLVPPAPQGQNNNNNNQQLNNGFGQHDSPNVLLNNLTTTHMPVAQHQPFQQQGINITSNSPNQTSSLQLPITFSQFGEHSQLVASYIAFKTHIFYLFEQWGLCRDKFICNLRNDITRNELFQLLHNDYVKLTEWLHKFKEFYSFCKRGADSSHKCFLDQEKIRQQQQLNQAHTGCIITGLQHMDINGTNQVGVAGMSDVLCYHVQITEPTAERSYDALGLKLELQHDAAGKYHITIRNFGGYAVKILEALFTLLDEDGFATSQPIGQPAISSDLDQDQQHDSPNPVQPAITSIQERRNSLTGSSSHTTGSTSYNTPPQNANGGRTSTSTTASLSQQGGPGQPKHPLLRNDWLDIISVNKPLTPFPIRQQNLVKLCRVKSINEVAPSFICFSFDSPHPPMPGLNPTDPHVIAQRLHKYTHYHPGYPEELRQALFHPQQQQQTEHTIPNQNNKKKQSEMDDEMKYDNHQMQKSHSSLSNATVFQSTQLSQLSASFLVEVSIPK